MIKWSIPSYPSFCRIFFLLVFTMTLSLLWLHKMFSTQVHKLLETWKSYCVDCERGWTGWKLCFLFLSNTTITFFRAWNSSAFYKHDHICRIHFTIFRFQPFLHFFKRCFVRCFFLRCCWLDRVCWNFVELKIFTVATMTVIKAITTKATQYSSNVSPSPT